MNKKPIWICDGCGITHTDDYIDKKGRYCRCGGTFTIFEDMKKIAKKKNN